ncbi:MAG: 3-dehydroquinate synthase [Propionibacteriaceae bacterium]|nr:3-dehydroquinate synthase [Propionibacteriaceae bacterium]
MIVEVNAAEPYTVSIGPGVSRQLGALTGAALRVAIIHPPTLRRMAERMVAPLDRQCLLIEVPDAEEAKSTTTLARCWDELARAGFTRSDIVVGLGGGATTDLAGFVAATWLRGIGYIPVPTSVLGMVDAAVGGKTGINLASGKNLVGAFWEPRAVLCDLELLHSLPAPEVSSGLAEVIKCGFISDPAILELVSSSAAESTDVTSDRFGELVYRAIAVKAKVVSADLRERTSSGTQIGREALNYGHTLGHAIEAHEKYTWRHGPAIAVGMVWMAEVSARLCGLDRGTVELHRELLAAVGLPTAYRADWGALRALMSLDKKTRGAALRLVGLVAAGQPKIISGPPEDVLAEAYHQLDEASAG